jgi:hypothetical protein
MKVSNGKCKTPFCGSGPWAWNSVPGDGYPTRERCLSVATTDERQKAAKIIQQFRSHEEIARKHDSESMSKELDQLARVAKSAHGGLPGELLRRQIREADHGKWQEAKAERQGCAPRPLH